MDKLPSLDFSEEWLTTFLGTHAAQARPRHAEEILRAFKEQAGGLARGGEGDEDSVGSSQRGVLSSPLEAPLERSPSAGPGEAGSLSPKARSELALHHIEIKMIEQAKQRYNTLGDWLGDLQEPEGVLEIRITEFQQKYGYMGLIAEMALTIHEMVEAFLCNLRVISDRAVDDFDLNWTGDGEPGDSPSAPYYKEHLFASKLERLFVQEAGLPWQLYNEILEGVPPHGLCSSGFNFRDYYTGIGVVPHNAAPAAPAVPGGPPSPPHNHLPADNLAVVTAPSGNPPRPIGMNMDGSFTRERRAQRAGEPVTSNADPRGSAVSPHSSTKESKQ